MNRDEIYEAISDFLALLNSDDKDAEVKEAALVSALDRLALAYHYSECKFDETDYPDAPRKDYQELRKVVSVLFPEYGYYNVAARISVEISEGGLHIGDAIDDITDIAIDMDEVLWLWKNTSVDNALWSSNRGMKVTGGCTSDVSSYTFWRTVVVHEMRHLTTACTRRPFTDSLINIE